MSDKYVVLAGGYDTKNVGDYAMLELFCNAASKSNTKVKLLSRHRESIFVDRYGVDDVIDNFEYSTKKDSQGKFYRGFNFEEDSSHLSKIKEELEGSQGLYIGGGRLLIDYTEDVMRGPLAYYQTLVVLCKFLNVPVYIYAMTIVPNKTERGDSLLRFIVDNCSAIVLRDEDSRSYLHEIGCRQENIHVLPDPAFLLNGSQSKLDNRRVAFSIRHIHTGWGGVMKRHFFLIWH